MGGMIAQAAAIERPERVRSITSIMSTTGSRRVGHPSYRTFGLLLGKPPREREAAIERVVKTFKTIGSPGYPFEEERVRKIAGRSFDRGHGEAGIARQLHAITASGDRTPELRELSIPALVIHGKSDILVNPSGGRATAQAIPNACLKLIEGMGHDLPLALWPDFVEEIAATAARAPEATIAQPA
jgi:pimeloyl-ACP methyl ester carboxylesterase